MIKKSCMYSAVFIALTPFLASAAPANTVVATINAGLSPNWLAVSPNNLIGYVANDNNNGVDVGTNHGDSVTVVDLTTNLPITTIYDASFMEPYTITLNAAGTKAYVTNSSGHTITIINTATNSVSGIISGFDGPDGMVITPDGNFAYVSNYGATPGAGSGNATTVNYVDLKTNAIIETIQVGLAPASLAISPDGAYVYVIDYRYGTPDDGTISIINTSDNSVELHAVTGLFGPFAIVISPDGKYAYVSNFGSNNFSPVGTTLSVVDLTSKTIIANIDLGIQPSGVAITPDGRYVYVSNYNTLYMNQRYFTGLTAGQGTVNIIDLATNTVIPPTIDVGQSPGAITISPNGEFAYVANYIGNTISVIALQSFQITAQGCKTQNKYLMRTDFINKLTWTVTGTSLPVSYEIYRDAALTDLAGIVSAEGPLVFLDHNRNPKITDTYYIIGINQAGTSSEPVVITVDECCC